MDQRTDRRLNILLFITGLLVVGSLLVALFAVPAVYESRDNSDRVAQGNNLSSCRSLLHSTLIDGPSTGLELARAVAERVTLDGLAAAFLGDKDASIIPAKNQASQLIDQTSAALENGTKRYQTAVRDSRKDPSAFLRHYCP